MTKQPGQRAGQAVSKASQGHSRMRGVAGIVVVLTQISFETTAVRIST